MQHDVTCIAVVLIGLLTAAAGPPATAPSQIQLPAVDGRSYRPLDTEGHKAVVLIFVLQDCPVCNGYAAELKRLAGVFGPRGAQFYLIHTDPALTDAEARAHANQYGFPLPVLLDRKHALVDRMHVATVPTAVVLGPDAAVCYQGRVDDLYVALGKPRREVTKHDLKDAITAVIEKKPVAVSRTQVIGCAVPDLSAR